MLHQEITDLIIKAYYNVYNKLGYGFLERVYENAMLIELKKMGLTCEKQKAVTVYYHEEIVGDFFADIIVNNTIIVELKACKVLHEKHEIQVINYLKATQIEVALLLNFGKIPQVKRKIFSNKYKK
ncbi:GxxExxY protein [Flavobacterium sp.]|uniref:GxxExxY protein n=1 Tax=Flavobacterium sp. TaxID=239 RepID=UPI002601AD36|nr:GxxExxY protein [Flavobacterium sp.]MDD2987072.1 GxxExxY protein [Flavobacterium sp.]